MSIKLDAQDFLQSPFSLYKQYRQQEPIAFVDEGFAKGGWFLTRYADIMAVLKDSRFSSDRRKLHTDRKPFFLMRFLPNFFEVFQNSMLMADDPDHRRLRDLVHKAFTPSRIENMNQRIEELCTGLLDSAAQKKQVDLIADFALPLPLTIISEMMGVPLEDRMKFRKWTSHFLEGAANPSNLLFQLPSVISMYRFLNKLIKLRQTDPQDDLVTGLVQATVQEDRLSSDETLGMLFLLLLAGHETTVNLIGNGMLAFFQHPDQMTKLHDHPELIDSAIEELLRYGNPVVQIPGRIALEDVEINGHCFPKGSTLILALASANRDETVFENPDDLDITRNPNKHVAFGFGIHYCLGAPLARMEGRIAIQMLVQRFPNMRLAVPPDQLKWRETVGVRGLESLPVILEP